MDQPRTAADLARRVLQIAASGEPHALRRIIELAGETLDQAEQLEAVGPARRGAG